MTRGNIVEPTDEMMQVFNATPLLVAYKYIYAYMVEYVGPFDKIESDFTQLWTTDDLLDYLFPLLKASDRRKYVDEDYLLSCAHPAYKDALKTASLELRMELV